MMIIIFAIIRIMSAMFMSPAFQEAALLTQWIYRIISETYLTYEYFDI